MGKHNSTYTRVKPLFDQIKGDLDKLNNFLNLINENIKLSSIPEPIYYGENEKILPPSIELLIYLVENNHILNQDILQKDDDGETRRKRKLLFDGNVEIRNEALNLLKRSNVPKSGWYIFEGYTQPDIYIETEDKIIIGEAKRTEDKLTTSTKWLLNKDQLIRHIDSVLDTSKNIFSFLIIDHEVSKNHNYKKGLENLIDRNYYKLNLPHRDEYQIDKAYKSYQGHLYWNEIETKLKINFPDTI